MSFTPCLLKLDCQHPPGQNPHHWLSLLLGPFGRTELHHRLLHNSTSQVFALHVYLIESTLC